MGRPEDPKSELYYNELTITAMGNHYNQYSTDFNGGYYFPTIEKMTGVHFDIDWRSDYNSTVVATALACMRKYSPVCERFF